MTMTIVPGSGGAQIVPGNANAFSFIGGFVGFFKDGGAIVNCHNTADVSGISDRSGSQVMVGGIIGGSHYSFSSDPHCYIADCSSTGDITVGALGAWPMAGGIAGVLAGGGSTLAGSTHITRCYAKGTISLHSAAANGWPYLGGIVGYLYVGAKVSQCYFDGSVIAEIANNYTGGIAGYSSYATGYNPANNNPGWIEDCWSSGLIRGNINAGGIVGQNQANVFLRRCYSTATVQAKEARFVGAASMAGVGGISGMNSSALTDALSACVALNPSLLSETKVNNALGYGENIYRVTGLNSAGANGDIANNYALAGMQLKAAGDPIDIVTVDSARLGPDQPHGEDLAEAKPAQSFYAGIGWSFSNVWKMGSDGYPKLRWQK